MSKIDKNLYLGIINSTKVMPQNTILPSANERKTFELSTDFKDLKIFVDIDRAGRLELRKCKIQDRYRSLPLIRVDIDSPPHRFKDGSTTSRNHIHIFNPDKDENDTFNLEDFDATLFKNINNFSSILFDFCSYCNIQMPNVQGVI